MLLARSVDVSPVTVNYAGGGSGKGRQDLADQLVDFAGSDPPMKDSEIAAAKAKGTPVHFPVGFGEDGVGLTLADGRRGAQHGFVGGPPLA